MKKEDSIMENQGNLGNDVKKLNIEELNTVAGGADYAYAQPILSKILARFKQLIASGMSSDVARAQVKNEYWAEVIEVCRRNPEENCSVEHQAEVIFSFVIGI